MSTLSQARQTHVDVRAIERALIDLWKQAAEANDADTRETVTRICLLNLVVCVSGEAAIQQVTEIITLLTHRYPNRAIVVSTAPESPDDWLDAWVQAHCRRPSPNRPQVCCEQISIEARGAAVMRVPGTILPLLVPDVPVVLWWPQGMPFDEPLFTRLCSLADRAIVDTATFDDPDDGLRRLAALLDGTMAISNLAWSRLTPWRELVAQFFDTPSMLPHLAGIDRVIIEYEVWPDAVRDRTQALLMVGWLASRLGWQPSGSLREQDGVTRCLLRHQSTMIAVELRPAEPKEDVLDHIAGLHLFGPDAHFSVGRAVAPDAAITRSEVAGMVPLERVVRLECLDSASLIGEELRLLGHDVAFEGALRMAAQVFVGGPT